MNYKRVFREIGKALAIVATFCGWLLGLSLSEMLFYDETLREWKYGSHAAGWVLSLVGAAVCGLSIWFICKFFEWLIFGFCGKKPKDEPNNKQGNR